MGTHSCTSFERERGQASLRGDHENVFATIFLPHVTFRFVKFVVRATHKACGLVVACGIAMCSHPAILKGDRHHPQATSLLLQLTHTLVGVAIRTTYWRVFFLLRSALGTAVSVVLKAKSCARSNMGQLNPPPEIYGVSALRPISGSDRFLYLQTSGMVQFAFAAVGLGICSADLVPSIDEAAMADRRVQAVWGELASRQSRFASLHCHYLNGFPLRAVASGKTDYLLNRAV